MDNGKHHFIVIVIILVVVIVNSNDLFYCGFESFHSLHYITHKKKVSNIEKCSVRKRIVREVGMGMYTLLYLKWVTSKDLLYSTWNSAQCYVASWMGEEFGGEWVHVYVWLSPFSLLLKPSKHC